MQFLLFLTQTKPFWVKFIFLEWRFSLKEDCWDSEIFNSEMFTFTFRKCLILVDPFQIYISDCSERKLHSDDYKR